jgi:hypothetical protein
MARQGAANDCTETLQLDAAFRIDRNGFEQIAYDTFV